MKFLPWELAIILTVILLWGLTLLTTFIAIWVGPWQMTTSAVVLFCLACVASGFLALVVDSVDKRKRGR